MIDVNETPRRFSPTGKNSTKLARTTRRQFLVRSIAATALLGLSTACRRFEIANKTDLDPEVLKKFSGGLKGRMILPADADYENARRVSIWNPTTARRPLLIVRCAHADDVTRSVEFAHRHRLETAVRAGGHSFQGWGTCNGLVIDLTGLKRVRIDPATRTGRVDAGVLSGDFTREAGRHGLAPVLGQCPGVGVAGVTLGGGLGWLSGRFGAACDNLLSVRVLTADGRSLLADASNNPELFWGMRGGGGNFGVATSFEFRLYPVATVTAGQIKYRWEDAKAVLQFYRNFMATVPDWFQADVSLSAGDRSLVIDVCHTGNPNDGERLLRGFRSVAAPSEDTVKAQAYADFCGSPPPVKENEKVPDGFLSTQGVYIRQFSQHVIDTILDRLAHAPAGAAIGLAHYMHGEVCRVKPGAAAFGLREEGAVHIWIDLMWQEPAAAERLATWGNETWRMLRSFSGGRIYANYQSYEGKGSSEAVFGDNHSRLAAIKKKYDPANFFRRNSNIRPTGQEMIVNV